MPRAARSRGRAKFRATGGQAEIAAAMHHAMRGRAQCQAGVACLQPFQKEVQSLLMLRRRDLMIDQGSGAVKHAEAAFPPISTMAPRYSACSVGATSAR